MTRETRTTIEPNDIIAVEFECRTCEARLVLKLDKLEETPVFCSRCQKQWVIHNSDAHGRLHNFLQRMREYSKAQNEPYILRFTIAHDASRDSGDGT